MIGVKSPSFPLVYTMTCRLIICKTRCNGHCPPWGNRLVSHKAPWMQQHIPHLSSAQQAALSSTLPDALNLSHMRFPISDSLNKEQLCCTALWSVAIFCLMDSFVPSLIMSDCTWDSHPNPPPFLGGEKISAPCLSHH